MARVCYIDTGGSAVTPGGDRVGSRACEFAALSSSRSPSPLPLSCSSAWQEIRRSPPWSRQERTPGSRRSTRGTTSRRSRHRHGREGRRAAAVHHPGLGRAGLARPHVLERRQHADQRLLRERHHGRFAGPDLRRGRRDELRLREQRARLRARATHPGGRGRHDLQPREQTRCVSFDVVDSIYSVRIDPDGKIVVAGLSATDPAPTSRGRALHLDRGSGRDVRHRWQGRCAGLGVGVAPYAGFVVAFDVAFDASTKKIWLVGGDNNDNPNPTAGYIARLNTGGALDIGFATSTGGILSDPTVDAFWSAADDGAGGIYAAGQTKSSPRRMVVKHFDASGKTRLDVRLRRAPRGRRP